MYGVRQRRRAMCTLSLFCQWQLAFVWVGGPGQETSLPMCQTDDQLLTGSAASHFILEWVLAVLCCQ